MCFLETVLPCVCLDGVREDVYGSVCIYLSKLLVCMRERKLQSILKRFFFLGNSFQSILHFFRQSYRMCVIEPVEKRMFIGAFQFEGFLFFGCAHGMWKFPGQGSNLYHTCNHSYSSNNTRSLTHRATSELLVFCFIGL